MKVDPEKVKGNTINYQNDEEKAMNEQDQPCPECGREIGELELISRRSSDGAIIHKECPPLPSDKPEKSSA